jgi:hypothetical protein
MTEPSEHETDPTRPGPARDAQANQAAADSVDTTRLLPNEEAAADLLLPGEDLSASYREDVELWVNVYSELLDFKRFMLDGASARAGAMRTEAARVEVETTDLRVARAEAERFIRRLSYWRGRLEELQAADPVDVAPGSARHA